MLKFKQIKQKQSILSFGLRTIIYKGVGILAAVYLNQDHYFLRQWFINVDDFRFQNEPGWSKISKTQQAVELNIDVNSQRSCQHQYRKHTRHINPFKKRLIQAVLTVNCFAAQVGC